MHRTFGIVQDMAELAALTTFLTMIAMVAHSLGA